MESRKVIVGTRKSELALVQTELIVSFLQERFPNHTFEIKKISTCGDKILDVALSKIGDKSLFTKELEVALLSNEIDFIVHSLKDVPTEMPEGTVLGCICNRVSPFDVVLMSPENRGKTLKDLPPSAVVGSSALRRIAQLRKLYPHLTFQSIRGNLNTRLAKLDGTFVSTKNIPYVKYDAIILAKAGVDRLGWGDRIDEVLSDFPYAVSQGALACECRQGDEEILSLLSCIHHEMSALSAIAERSFMRRLQGGCCTPIAVSSFPDPSVERSTKLSHLALTGTVMNLDASKSVTKSMAINLPFNCNFKLKSRRRRGKKVYSDTSGYSTSSSSGSTGFYNDELYDGDFQLISNAYDEAEVKIAVNPCSTIVGLNVQPMCKIGRLRMARAHRLGAEIADDLLKHGAAEILAETKQLARDGQRLTAKEVSSIIESQNNAQKSPCKNTDTLSSSPMIVDTQS